MSYGSVPALQPGHLGHVNRIKSIVGQGPATINERPGLHPERMEKQRTISKQTPSDLSSEAER